MRAKFSILLMLLFASFQFSGASIMDDHTFYDFTFYKLKDNSKMSLDDFRGQVVLVVNTASECYLASQYDGLEKLYQKYKDRGFVIIGIPSDDFGSQEFENNNEIESFCRVNYGVTFPMTSKEKVSGPNAHPFYIWARKELGFLSAPKWNFHKYLIDKNGKVVDYFYSITPPTSERLSRAIENALL